MPLSDIRALLDLLPEERHPIYLAAAAATDELQLREALHAAGLAAGVEPRAWPDYLARGLKTFRVEGGSVVPSAPRWSRYRPQEQLGVEEWATALRTEAPHLFRKERP